MLFVCECGCESSNHLSFGQFGLVYLITLDNFGLIYQEGRLPLHLSLPFLRKET